MTEKSSAQPSFWNWIASRPKPVRDQLISRPKWAVPKFKDELDHNWAGRARDTQKPPPGDWRVWLLLAGRGFGKTRTGAEFVRAEIAAGRARRVALVAPTEADVRGVMVEGESGLIAVHPRLGVRPLYQPSNRRLIWPNGAIATTFSAEQPERLRGPQHDLAWCDELAAWRYPEAWDMLLFGLRLGDNPRIVVTTTPRPTKLVRALLADPTVVVTRGTTSTTPSTSRRPFSIRSCAAIRAPGSAARSSTPKCSTTCPARYGAAG